jgi:tetratricopeptide (TPR) repeat protein
MVLYEDLRIYTIWRTDMARAKQGQDASSEYQKSAEEWEILGDLADRLHHPNEAVEAYQACLRVRFSPKAMHGVLKMYERQGRYQEMLQAMIRLIAWQYRWYSEVGPGFFRTFTLI